MDKNIIMETIIENAEEVKKEIEFAEFDEWVK